MAEKSDNYKAFYEISKSYGKPLASINKLALKTIANTTSELSSVISQSTKISLSNLSFYPQLMDTICSLSKSYTYLLADYNLSDKNLVSKFTNFQISSVLQLSQSVDTEMIRGIKKCFANARYDELVNVLNKSLSSNKMKAADIAFIKTSELVSILNSEIKYPKGFLSSLKLLNVNTAYKISDNLDLKYDTHNFQFVSKNGVVDSKGLNAICSGKEVLSSFSKELFSENDLVDFISFLYSTPMLGLQNDTGKRIFDLINELYKSNKKRIGFDKDFYFHSRTREKDEMPFVFEQMQKAPTGLPSAGRYNSPGRSYFYFSNTKKGAEAEVKKHSKRDCNLQTMKIKPNSPVKLLDLSGTLTSCKVFLQYLRFGLKDCNDNWPREYLLPCFVGQCCKYVGFDGIKYYGSKDYDNYVTWNDGYFVYIEMC